MLLRVCPRSLIATKVCVGVFASTLALPASAQSYRHAPPRTAVAPLVDTSAIPSLSSITAQLPFGNAPARQSPASRSIAPIGPSHRPVQSMAYRPPVPSHLSENNWSRPPESIPAAPVPYQQSGQMAMVPPPQSPQPSAAYYAMNARQTAPRDPQSFQPPPAPPANQYTAPVAAAPNGPTAAQLFAAGHPEPRMALAPVRQQPTVQQTSAAPLPQRQTTRRTVLPPAQSSPRPLDQPASATPAAAQGSNIELAAYARPARQTPPSRMQQPPVPPASPRVPSATMPRRSPMRTPSAAAPIQPAAASAPAVPATPPPAAPILPPVGFDRLAIILVDAQRALARHDYERAEQYLDQARSYAPQDARPEALRARLYEARGQWKQAVETFDRLIILEPLMATWKLARARAQFRLGEYAKSIVDFRTVEATSARLSLNDYTLLCEAAFRSGDAATVHHALAMIEQINPEPHPRSELIRGLIAFRAGQGSEARNILLRAAARWPRNAALTEALRRTSAVYYRDKRPVDPSAKQPLATSMTTAESASLDLVKEYTPPAPKSSAAIWGRPDASAPATTQTENQNPPASLGSVFAEPNAPSDKDEHLTGPVTIPNLVIVPADYSTAKNRSIGFQ